MAVELALLVPSLAVLAGVTHARRLRRLGRPLPSTSSSFDPRANFRIVQPHLAPVIPLRRHR